MGGISKITIMENTYTYKRQGDGRDSWVCVEPNGNKYMVYEDPTKPQTTIDIDSLTDEQIQKLKARLGL
jgi:hypothetical protein